MSATSVPTFRTCNWCKRLIGDAEDCWRDYAGKYACKDCKGEEDAVKIATKTNAQIEELVGLYGRRDARSIMDRLMALAREEAGAANIMRRLNLPADRSRKEILAGASIQENTDD